ncbi:MAG: hypothetical protein JST59_29355 [Actinobacteria bacterium]|nr:hypothetical protein [Actinomycetota bacterium]
MGPKRGTGRRRLPFLRRAARSRANVVRARGADQVEPASLDRGQAAIRLVRRGILQAEEKYLVEPGASLGTWFARVQEPICVACRVALVRLAEGRRLGEADVAEEQVGLHADICAEAIRAAAQLWRGGPSPEAREEILALVAGRARCVSAVALSDVLVALVGYTAALEPIANGLREEDLPMGDPIDRDAVTACLADVIDRAFGVIRALC